ncbi:MAG: DUF177 domain-containing protein [Hyphomicrobiaceae bacterium]|nr:DUF177 domain-containing protein [Hyphomicrobiaceae bacterium]
MSRHKHRPGDLGLLIPVDVITHASRTLDFEADKDQLVWLTGTMHVSEIRKVAAQFSLVREAEGVHVTGTLTATVVQPCIVTLEPVTQQIDVPLDRRYLPERMRVPDPGPASETHVDLDSEDLPDYFVGGDVDLAPLVIDTLGMEIDLYPRAPGAELPETRENAPSESTSPFAALAARFSKPADDN